MIGQDDPVSQSQFFAGMQWRLGELYKPSRPCYEAGTPWRCVVDPAWESDTLTQFEDQLILPANVV
jgi:hypothetical protein